MGKKRDLQVLRTIDGETRTVGSSSPPDFLRYFDFPIFSYYYYITMFRCCCWNWFVGGSDDDRCRDSDDFGIAELTRAAATETVTPPDCVPFRFSFPSFPLDSVQQQELLLNRNRQQQQQQQQKDETPPSLSSSGPLSPPPFFLLVSSPPRVLSHHLLPADGPGGARLSSCSSH